MHKYLTQPDFSYHSVTVGYKSKQWITPKLMVPRTPAINSKGEQVMHQNGFPIKIEIRGLDIFTTQVDKWTASQDATRQLPANVKSSMLKFQFFLHLDKWRALLVFHDKSKCNPKFANGNHVHVILETKIPALSVDNDFRTFQRHVQLSGGYCTTSKLTGSILHYLQYLAVDPEKIFMGTNSTAMLEMFTSQQQLDPTLPKPPVRLNTWELQEEKDDGPKVRTWDQFDVVGESSEENISGISPECAGTMVPTTSDIGEEAALSDRCAPKHLTNEKSGQTVEYIYNQLKRFQGVTTIQELMAKYEAFTPEWHVMCSIGSNTTSQKNFQLALGMIEDENNRKVPLEVIADLPDKMKGYMTPMHSLAILNAWLKEQNIKPRYWFTIMHTLLSNKGKKRCGVYLHGAGSAGKTMITNSTFNCIEPIVGRLTRDRFPFQVCGWKKMIIGEEVGITSANLDRFKDLMSGSKVSCDRKNKDPSYCQPSIVLLNSNVKHDHALDQKSSAILALRLYLFQNLTASAVITENHCYGLLHPKLYCIPEKPSEIEMMDARANKEAKFTDEPLRGRTHKDAYVYQGSWDDIPADYVPDEDSDSEEEDNITVIMNTDGEYRPDTPIPPLKSIAVEDIYAVEEDDDVIEPSQDTRQVFATLSPVQPTISKKQAKKPKKTPRAKFDCAAGDEIYGHDLHAPRVIQAVASVSPWHVDDSREEFTYEADGLVFTAPPSPVEQPSAKRARHVRRRVMQNEKRDAQEKENLVSSIYDSLKDVRPLHILLGRITKVFFTFIVTELTRFCITTVPEDVTHRTDTRDGFTRRNQDEHYTGNGWPLRTRTAIYFDLSHDRIDVNCDRYLDGFCDCITGLSTDILSDFRGPYTTLALLHPRNDDVIHRAYIYPLTEYDDNEGHYADTLTFRCPANMLNTQDLHVVLRIAPDWRHDMKTDIDVKCFLYLMSSYFYDGYAGSHNAHSISRVGEVLDDVLWKLRENCTPSQHEKLTQLKFFH